MRLLSWNINGIRAAYKKGFLDWFLAEMPDILGVQEVKAMREQVPKALVDVPGYYSFINPAEKPGYAGTAVWSKVQPNKVEYGFGDKKFDDEGRTIILYFDDFVFFNIYFPNGGRENSRVQFKLEFYDAFLNFVEKLKGKNIIVCGDTNTAHKEIDLARPKENVKNTGFLPEERAWIDKFVSKGYVDTFRRFVSDGGHYSYWDQKTRARERNVGWRLDYFYVSENFVKSVKDAFILDSVLGSDHCPVGVTINIKF